MKRMLCLLALLALLPASVFAEGAEMTQYLVSDGQKVFSPEETEPFAEDAELLTLRVCPLLGADCMLLTFGEHSMLIDSGGYNHGPTIMKVVQDAGLDSVEYAFNTHPHNDHLGGMIPLLKLGLGVGTFMTTFPHDYVANKGEFEVLPETVRAMEAANIPVTDVKRDERIPFGDAEVTVLAIPETGTDLAGTCNELSAMLMVRYGTCSLLLTADVEPSSEKLLTEMYNLKADILKYPHHGQSKLEEAFYADVAPELVFFTHGAGNTQMAQKQLGSLGMHRMLFATWGVITMQTDGTKWIVKQDLLPDFVQVAETYVFP